MPKQDALTAYIQTASYLPSFGVRPFQTMINNVMHLMRINYKTISILDNPGHIAYECQLSYVQIINVYPDQGVELQVPHASGNGQVMILRCVTPVDAINIAHLIKGYQECG